MSKQSDAKAFQNYTTDAKNCGNCPNKISDMIPQKWMVEHNAALAAGNKTYPKPYVLEDNLIEKNMRCGVGCFAVKKTGSCDLRFNVETAK